jgi:hypothetical protein
MTMYQSIIVGLHGEDRIAIAPGENAATAA